MLCRSARNYQKFSNGLQRLFTRSRGNLRLIHCSFHQGKKDHLAKRTRITVETDSLLIVRGLTSRRAWCDRCEAEVEIVAMKETGVMTNLDQAAIEEWLDSEDLHHLQSTDGSALICLNSLLARVQKTQTS